MHLLNQGPLTTRLVRQRPSTGRAEELRRCVPEDRIDSSGNEPAHAASRPQSSSSCALPSGQPRTSITREVHSSSRSGSRSTQRHKIVITSATGGSPTASAPSTSCGAQGRTRRAPSWTPGAALATAARVPRRRQCARAAVRTHALAVQPASRVPKPDRRQRRVMGITEHDTALQREPQSVITFAAPSAECGARWSSMRLMIGGRQDDPFAAASATPVTVSHR